MFRKRDIAFVETGEENRKVRETIADTTTVQGIYSTTIALFEISQSLAEFKNAVIGRMCDSCPYMDMAEDYFGQSTIKQ